MIKKGYKKRIMVKKGNEDDADWADKKKINKYLKCRFTNN